MTNDFRLARKNLGAAIATTVAAAGILFLTVGCSTKNYVRSQTAPLVQNTNDLDAKTAQDHRTILDTDQRARPVLPVSRVLPILLISMPWLPARLRRRPVRALKKPTIVSTRSQVLSPIWIITRRSQT